MHLNWLISTLLLVVTSGIVRSHAFTTSNVYTSTSTIYVVETVCMSGYASSGTTDSTMTIDGVYDSSSDSDSYSSSVNSYVDSDSYLSTTKSSSVDYSTMTYMTTAAIDSSETSYTAVAGSSYSASNYSLNSSSTATSVELFTGDASFVYGRGSILAVVCAAIAALLV